MRSTGSRLNTKRTWRSATGPPQPRIGVAATLCSSSRFEDLDAVEPERRDVEQQRPAALRGHRR